MAGRYHVHYASAAAAVEFADAAVAVTASITAAGVATRPAAATRTTTALLTAAADVSTPPTYWGPPLNITATPTSPTQINLAWDSVAYTSGYDVERDGVVIALNHPDTAYFDIGLTASTSYDYRVRSVRGTFAHIAQAELEPQATLTAGGTGGFISSAAVVAAAAVIATGAVGGTTGLGQGPLGTMPLGGT